MEIIGIIAARSGSKGFAGKHMKQIAGQPVLAHAIDCALRAFLMAAWTPHDHCL